MQLINNTKTSYKTHKIALFYGDSDHDTEITHAVTKILQLLKIQCTITAIEMSQEAERKHIKYGISSEYLSEIMDSDCMLSAKSKNHDLQKYLNMALDLKLQTISAININNLWHDIKIISPTQKIFNNNEYKKSLLHYAKQISENIILITNPQDLLSLIKSKKLSDNNVIINLTDNNITSDIIVTEYSNIEYSSSAYIGSNFGFFTPHGANNSISMILSIIQMLQYLNYLPEATILKYILIKTMIDEKHSNISSDIDFTKLITNNIIKYSKKPTKADLPSMQSMPKFYYTEKENQNHINERSENQNYIYLKVIKTTTVRNLIKMIKDKEIKIPEGYKLWQIYAKNIEVYPNEAFWHKEFNNYKLLLIPEEAI